MTDERAPDICPRCLNHGEIFSAQPVGYRALGPHGWAYLPVATPCPECSPARTEGGEK